ncbi:hypothetical protein GCM10023169_25120 [Georgenia halophila]|uniref:Uncharacterized protein n=1 Tax=Georgenia halophila TaxID=620889 RepID=A0ABP8LDI6_9MICO
MIDSTQVDMAGAERTARWPNGVLASALVLGTVAFAARRATSPPDVPPSYSGPRPVTSGDGYVPATHSVFIDATPEKVWVWNAAPDRTLEELVHFGTATLATMRDRIEDHVRRVDH